MMNETELELFEKYNDFSRQLTKYLGGCVYLMCLCGTAMNILTFAQRTYNRRVCSLYLLTASTCDLIHINVSLLSNVLQYGFQHNWIFNSVIFCKVKSYVVYILVIISGTLTVFTAIDRYMISSRESTRWRFSRRSVAIQCVKWSIVFWIVLSIPIIICSERFHHFSGNEQLICSIPGRQPVCLMVQVVYTCLLNGFFPPLIILIFSLLTRRNAHHLYRRSHGRSTRIRRINEQLSTMLILQSIKSIFSSYPYSLFNTYWIIAARIPKSLAHQAIENLVYQIVTLLFWSNYTSFFIYIYSSDIFKDQWMDVMRLLLCCRCLKRRSDQSSQPM